MQRYDPFKILGISVDTPPRQIKEAFKRAVLKTHPDRPGGNQQKFELVKQAYEDIKDMIRGERESQNMQNRTKAQYLKERNMIDHMNLPAEEVSKMKTAFTRDPKLFHQMFEATRIKKNSDKGYSLDQVDDLIKKKQEKYQNRLQIRKKVFNPTGVNTDLKFLYEEVGKEDVKNHNSDYINSDYVDVVEGFVDRDVANIPMPEHRLNEFKSVDQYMAFSNTQKEKKATPEEMKYYKLQEQKKRREAALRKINAKKRFEQEKKSTMSFSRFLELKREGKIQ